MPAVLPPTIAFTYCAELKVDGVERVRFEKPVVSWVDNFLGFDVGEIVPVGYYNRDRGVWVASDNGVVVRLLDEDSDGVVDALDADGDDVADDLNEDGDFADEVLGLEDPAYAPGATYWRVEVSHFTPWDCNWPYGPPADAINPNPQGQPDLDQQKEDDCDEPTGSFVNCRSRIYHEDISIPGTNLTLHYASNRVKDYKTVISVPASGDTVPASLKNIIVKVEIAGRTFEQILNPLPNQKAEFQWDGLDYLGNQVEVAFTHVSIGFVYDGVYWKPGEDDSLSSAFGMPGASVTLILTRQEIISWKFFNIDVSSLVNMNNMLADGWTLSNHHYLQNIEFSLFKGNGTIVKENPRTINTIAGNGYFGYSGDGVLATEAELDYPLGVAVDSKGNIYIGDTENHRIRKINIEGIITTIAGNGSFGYSGDGGLAIEAELDYPRGV
ncbi:MAG: hypothetical protein KAJ19_25415, partial [Gammaproteobacteria bacterium]|nr:hypothetical protein [Gammaproteobacteria bacterium]